MLTVRHGRPEAAPSLQEWFAMNRPTIAGHALWAVSLLCLAVLGHGTAGVPGAHDIASLGAGLL